MATATRKHFNQFEAAKYPSPTAKNPWCIKFPNATQRESTAKARLFAFSHAGGNSSSYRPWDALVGPDISLIAIELPGRLTRFKDPLLKDVQTIVKNCVEQGMLAFLDRPFFIFGHSFGSIVAFEVTRYLQKVYNLSPICLFVSSSESPLRQTKEGYTLSDKDLIDHLIVTYKDAQLEKVRREHPDLLEMVTPVVRADITASDSYVFTPGTLLQCPLVFFYGKDEVTISPKDVEEWGAQTVVRDKYESKAFPGGHFYLQDTQMFMEEFNKYLSKFMLTI